MMTRSMPRDAREHRRVGRLRRDRDAVAGPGELGREARELDHVAASLLGEQHEEIAVERLAAASADRPAE